MGIVKNASEEDIFQDMEFYICKICGCIQLKKLIPPEILYKHPHNGAIGHTWEKHHFEFSNFILKHATGDVLEIGGGNLNLANKIAASHNIKNVKVVDTNKYIKDYNNKITIMDEFFNDNFTSSKTDCIIHSHTLEHFYTPLNSLRKMNNLLCDGGYMFASVPIIDVMVDDFLTNSLNFEHTFMLTFKNLEYMLNSCGFIIEESRKFNKYNYFIKCIKKDIKSTIPVECDANITKFNKFIDYHKNMIQDINNAIKDKKNVFVFGAHIFTQYLIHFGLDQKLLGGVLDNDSSKIGNRLYGTSLTTFSPQVLKMLKNPIVILKTGQYINEIKNDILRNINPTTIII